MKSFYWLESVSQPDGLYIKYYGKDGRWLEKSNFKPYCYIQSKDKTDIKCGKTGISLIRKDCDTVEGVHDMAKDQTTWEADVSYERKFMLDNDLKIDNVRKAYVDIETEQTDGISDPNRDAIISIAILFDDGREVYLSRQNYTEKVMIKKFISEMENVGMIITWNGGEDIWELRSFDMPYLGKRHTSQYEFDRDLRHCAFVDLYRDYKHEKMRVGLGLAGGYSLENVSQNELGHGKIKHDKPIHEMTDDELRAYNMMDVKLVKEIDDKLRLTDLRISIAQTCNLRLTEWRRNKKRREMSPLKQVDQLFLRTCHDNNMAWPTGTYIPQDESFEGALILEPEIGIYHNVQNMDIKSMYPSIIINERLSPDKDRKIIPELLSNVLKRRRELKKQYQDTGEDRYYLWQYAYKVIANTTYGAMANVGFRGYNREIAQAITNKGRALLKGLKQKVEDMGYKVIYGDTDSIFTLILPSKADTLLKILNRQIAPYELELGEFYDGMIFTGNESGGIKKRYAGISNNVITMKGLEGVRSDYCVLARETQYLILGKLLSGGSITDCKICLRNIKTQMLEGKYDDWLIMTKGVKPISEYVRETKTGTKKRLLPHVRALEKAVERGETNLNEISYYLTQDDTVEPVFEGVKVNNIDYEAYYSKQVYGVVRSLFNSIIIQQGGKKNPSWRMRKASEESTSLLEF